MRDRATASLAFFLSLLAAAAATTAGASEPEHAGAESHHAHQRHVVSILMVVVTEERAEGGPGIGVDYEYHFHQNWGASAFAEYVVGSLEIGVFGVMANYHPTERLLIGTGPGVESSHHGTQSLWRLGGLYEFEAGEVTIAPALYWDWLESGHHAFVMGLSFGKRF
jgi:hypothetical protein